MLLDIKCRKFYCREGDTRLIFYYLEYLNNPLLCGTVSNVFYPETESEFIYYKNKLYIGSNYFSNLEEILQNIIKQLN